MPGLPGVFAEVKCYKQLKILKGVLSLLTNLTFRCVAKINPTRGNKRPKKEATVAVGGHFSSRQVHDKLASLSLAYDEFLAQNEADSADDQESEEELD